MDHDNCNCDICSGKITREELNHKEKRMMKEYGWYAHIVAGDPQSPTGFNYHTHGFRETLDHPDIQIVLPIRGEHCHSLAANLFRQIKEGKRFADKGQTTIRHADGKSEFVVKFIEVKESGRDVLRVILPNPDGKHDPVHLGDNDTEYALQWTVTAV